MNTKNLLLIIGLLLLATNNFAYSVYDLHYGSEISHHDARTAALGGSGVAGGFTLMDSSINPANLYYMINSGEIQLSYSLIKNSENRAFPLWNFFDSYIDESTYARNENYYNEWSFSLKNSWSIDESEISLAYIRRPVYNFGANYTEEVRNDEGSNADNYPPIIAKNFLESKGLLNSDAILFNFGMPLYDDIEISLGLEWAFYTGKYEYERRIHWSDVANEMAGLGVLTDTLNIFENKLGTNSGINLGFSSQITERFRIGYAFSNKVKVSSHLVGDNIDEKTNFTIPARHRFGFLFQPRNPFKTNFQADFEIINYSEINKFFDDGYAFYVGMEHYIGRAVPLRLGFSHKTAKQDSGIGLPSLSAGTGFKIVNNVYLDLAAEYGKREYIDLDLFPDSVYAIPALWNQISPADRGWDNPDNVSESFFKIFTSLNFAF